jgi:hypothetical protein
MPPSMSKNTESSGCAEKCAEATNASTPFVKVLDGRKQPIRNLWQRGNTFYARLTVTSRSGAKVDTLMTMSWFEPCSRPEGLMS